MIKVLMRLKPFFENAQGGISMFVNNTEISTSTTQRLECHKSPQRSATTCHTDCRCTSGGIQMVQIWFALYELLEDEQTSITAEQVGEHKIHENC